MALHSCSWRWFWTDSLSLPPVTGIGGLCCLAGFQFRCLCFPFLLFCGSGSSVRALTTATRADTHTGARMYPCQPASPSSPTVFYSLRQGFSVIQEILGSHRLTRLVGWWAPKLLPYLFPSTGLQHGGSGDQTQVFLLVSNTSPTEPALASFNWIIYINEPLDVLTPSFTISMISLSLPKIINNYHC